VRACEKFRSENVACVQDGQFFKRSFRSAYFEWFRRLRRDWERQTKCKGQTKERLLELTGYPANNFGGNSVRRHCNQEASCSSVSACGASTNHRMHMRIQIAAAFVTTVLVMVFLLPGCNSKKENEGPGTEVIEQTYKINPNASVRIDNPRGSVTIRGTDGSDAQLQAVKSASSAAHLKDITVNVTAEPGDILIK